MSQAGKTSDPFDPFGQWQAARDRGMDAWSQMMLDFVQSDAYSHASAQWLDTYLKMSQSFQNAVDSAVNQTLGQYKIPTTDDIERLAERLWNVELKLDDLDARLDQVLALLQGLSQTSDEKPEASGQPAKPRRAGASSPASKSDSQERE